MIDSRFYELAGPFSLSELLADIDVQDPLESKFADEVIQMPEKLQDAMPGAITFLANRKNKDSLQGSQASACFVSEKLAPLVSEQSIIPIVSSTPRAHFARVVAKMVKKKSGYSKVDSAKVAASADIHPTAVIGQDVEIGEDVVIGPYCILGVGVSIGARTVLEGHVMVECAVIGEDGVIKKSAHIGGEGFGIDGDSRGIVNLPHIGTTIIGDRVRIGSHSCVDRGFLGDTNIGDDVKVDNLVQIAHNCTIGDGVMLAGHVGISGSCTIGKNVKMGGAVGIADHLTIGEGVQIAASSGVMHNIPAGEVWAGTPAMPIREQARILLATRKLLDKKKT